MTQLLDTALEQVRCLPPQDQDAIAALILEELADEQRWQESFDRSRDILSRMAAEALAEHRQGRTLPLDPDAL